MRNLIMFVGVLLMLSSCTTSRGYVQDDVYSNSGDVVATQMFNALGIQNAMTTAKYNQVNRQTPSQPTNTGGMCPGNSTRPVFKPSTNSNINLSMGNIVRKPRKISQRKP